MSCKYLFDYVYDDKDDDKNFLDENGITKMPCWQYLKTENGFDIYENTAYVPMGFTYESFITEEEFERIPDTHKSEAVLYAMVLSREQMEKYSQITGYDEEKYSQLYGDEPDEFASIVDNYSYGKNVYRGVCQKLAASSCSEFSYNKDGFTAVFDNEGEENLLFFSVPYSEGFSAYVNGEKTEIEKVQNGFMAVKVPANTECEIEFLYETPGLSTGLAVTAMAAGAFAIYIIVLLIYKKKIKK